MALLGMDLGGTKLASAVFTEDGKIIRKSIFPLDRRKGSEVGQLINGTITDFLRIYLPVI